MLFAIRTPKPSEIERIKKITKRAYQYPYKENGAVTRIKEPLDFSLSFRQRRINILAACCGGRIVGAIRYEVQGRRLYFCRLAVLKRWRKKGAGSALVKAAEKAAKDRGCRQIYLYCLIEKRLPAFYEKLGYRAYKKSRFGRFHGVYMAKRV